jgi:hypothetical protein
VNKSFLGKLRKKTGYTFANCRKALELHDGDVEKVKVSGLSHGITVTIEARIICLKCVFPYRQKNGYTSRHRPLDGKRQQN